MYFREKNRDSAGLVVWLTFILHLHLNNPIPATLNLPEGSRPTTQEPTQTSCTRPDAERKNYQLTTDAMAGTPTGTCIVGAVHIAYAREKKVHRHSTTSSGPHDG